MSTTPVKYTLTNESITVIHQGKPHTVQKGSPHFAGLRKAIIEEAWEKVPEHLTVAKSLKEWAKGKFELVGEAFYYNGEALPSDINKRIIAMATGGEDPTPLFKFYERLQKNPSYRSVQQLYPFLQHEGIPFTQDGCFLAYKSVRHDYKDHHSGKWDNSPGAEPFMDRNKISDDPKVPCHEGFHVGALAYARTFGSGSDKRIVVCEVDPENVVCIPYDSSHQKMRVCRYKVIGNHNGEYLPSTTFVEDKYAAAVDTESEDYDDEVDEDIESEDESSATKDAQSLKLVDDVAKEDASGQEAEAIPAKKDRTQEPKKSKAGKNEKRSSHKGYAKFDKMGMQELLACSIDELRAYAGKGLDIVGASKIPGGKVALVNKILQVRK